jgi:hypothetical protein
LQYRIGQHISFEKRPLGISLAQGGQFGISHKRRKVSCKCEQQEDRN